MRTITCVLAFIACSEPIGKSDPVDPVDTDLPQTEPPAQPTPSDPVEDPADPAASPDYARVEAFLSAGGDVAALMQDIAWSGGWPVVGPDDILIVAPGDGPLSVAGDFNGWTPEPMAQAVGVRWIRIASTTPEGQAYKLVEGDTYFADPWSRSYDYDEFGRLSYLRPPTDRPHLERWPGFAGEGLVPRDLRVWVPEGDGPWPMLVMHDGQNLFDPEALWGGWQLREALSGLDEDILVVGVDNTPDRLQEYTHVPDAPPGVGPVEPLGDAYADLVVLDLLPWASSTWSTTGVHGVMGSSLGGLISLHIADRHPEAFQFVGSLSGTLGWGRFTADEELMAARWLVSSPELVVYVDSGGGPGDDGVCSDPDGDGSVADDPDDSDNYCTTRAFADAMAGAGYVWDATLHHWWEPGASHNEQAWAARVSRPLGIFLSR